MAVLRLELLLLVLCVPYCLTCPSTLCVCEPNKQQDLIINCRSRNLQEVPTWSSSSTTYAELSLGGNPQIKILKNNSFSGLKIRKLDITDNGINTIENGAFTGIDASLEELVLETDYMTAIPTKAFQQLPNLKMLTLRNFQVSSLPSNAFSYFNALISLTMEECGLSTLLLENFNGISDTLEILSLISNQISTIPSQALASLVNLRTLNITYSSNLVSIPSNAFASNQRLENLDLSLNGITTITSSAFQGLSSNLKHLMLPHNSLTDNQMTFISGLHALEELDLSYNKLSNIPTSLLTNLGVLKTLDLQSNEINKIYQSSVPSSALLTLNLADNPIVEIEANSFMRLRKLEELNLDRLGPNSDIKADSLKGLQDTLKTLFLEGNSLTEQDLPKVNYLKELRNLHIGQNNIVSLPDRIFSNLENLQVLDLNQNQISTLNHNKTFGLHASLKKLDVGRNKIRTISECTFYGFNLLRDIELTENPLHCDCKLKWLHKWMNSFIESSVIQNLEWRCKTPSNLQSRKLNQLRQEDFVCSELYSPPVCDNIVTFPTSSPSGSSIFQVTNITNITHNSFTIHWTSKDNSIVAGYLIDLQKHTTRGQGDFKRTNISKNARKYNATDLEPDSEYIVGVTSLFTLESGEANMRIVKTVKTLKQPQASVAPTNNTLKIILGAVFGALALIAIIVVVVLVYKCRKQEEEDPYARPGQFRRHNKLASHGSLPTVSENTQRFSKSKTASMGTLHSVGSLDRLDFSPEERDRILNMLTHSGGTTISMISNSSGGYLGPELPPRPANLQPQPKGGPVYEEIQSDT